jgi:hypothetical protein
MAMKEQKIIFEKILKSANRIVYFSLKKSFSDKQKVDAFVNHFSSKPFISKTHNFFFTWKSFLTTV